jgi:hypothetical protein
MNLNPLPKCIFLVPIVDARVLGNVQHAQANLMLFVNGKILALLGAGRRSRRHQEKNLLFPVVFDRAGKYLISNGPGAVANKSATITRASPATLDPCFTS